MGCFIGLFVEGRLRFCSCQLSNNFLNYHNFNFHDLGLFSKIRLILKRWDSSELDILKRFYPNLTCKPFDFIFVGKNLFFDFCMLNERLKHHGLGEIDLRCLNQRVSIDIKPLLVIMNDGNFKGYDKVIPKTNPTTNEMIPKLYKEGEYSEIIQYIRDETKDFVQAYQVFKKEMPKLKRYIQMS
jgi:hypothetical protein